MNHLNEDILIQYAFELLDAPQKQTAEKHLADCADCRDKLEQVRRQYAGLDVLDADTALSEELIGRTLAQKSAGTKSKVIPFYRRAWAEWAAAAAAVVLICVLLLQGLPDTEVKEPAPTGQKGVAINDKDGSVLHESGKMPAPSKSLSPVAKRDEPDNHPGLTATPPSKGGELKTTTTLGLSRLKSSPPAKGEYPERGEGVITVVSADAIPDVAPFAPASAIELVVLPNPDTMQLTIYNSADLTLVRDRRKLTLKPGWNWLQFMWSGTLIDPTSLELAPLEHADKIDIQQLVYPARLKDIGRWLIRSEVEGAVPFEITYFASGLSWRAFYMGTMNEDETTMDLKGYVNVANNSGQDFHNAQTRLIVGQTRLMEEISRLAQRQYPYGPDAVERHIKKQLRYPTNWKEIKDDKSSLMLGDMPVIGRYFTNTVDFCQTGYAIKGIEKKGLSEYFLYTIEGTEDLPNQWTKRLPSFDVSGIPVTSLYKYDDDRYGKEVVRFVSFKNNDEHELGETPIPEGSVKLYRNLNTQQNLSYVGAADVKYIPVNEDVELNMGPARLVKVEPTLMDTKTENYRFNNKGNIDGWDDIESYQVTVTNTREVPIDMEITWNMGTEYWELVLHRNAAGAVYKKHDARRGRFTLTVYPRSESVFMHTIRKYRKTRAVDYVKKMKEQEK